MWMMLHLWDSVRLKYKVVRLIWLQVQCLRMHKTELLHYAFIPDEAVTQLSGYSVLTIIFYMTFHILIFDFFKHLSLPLQKPLTNKRCILHNWRAIIVPLPTNEVHTCMKRTMTQDLIKFSTILKIISGSVFCLQSLYFNRWQILYAVSSLKRY